MYPYEPLDALGAFRKKVWSVHSKPCAQLTTPARAYEQKENSERMLRVPVVLHVHVHSSCTRDLHREDSSFYGGPCLPLRRMWAHPIMKLCEDACGRTKCASDVVNACLSSCVASHDANIGPQSGVPNAESLAPWLPKHLLLCTGDVLCQRRPPKVLWHVLLACWTVCVSWLFPEQSRWRRSSTCLELLFAAVACCRSLVWLSGQSLKKWPCKASAGATSPVGVMLAAQAKNLDMGRCLICR